MTELATPPNEQREGLTRITHWIGGKPVQGASGRTGPVFNPALGHRGGRRCRRGGEGGVPGLARDLVGEARGADVQDSRARARAS